jgi:glucokinase
MRRRPILAVDLGGTNIRMGIIDSAGKILARRRVRMPAVPGREQLYEALASRIGAALDADSGKRNPAAVSIGFAGFTDASKGLVYFAPNVARLTDLEIGPRLECLLGMPVYVENDANCAALGEFWHGAGCGSASLFMFTLGTGIGGGFVVDGKVWEGNNGIAGEIGHHIIAVGGPECACGNKGCLEAFASAGAIVRAYSRRAKGRSTGKTQKVTARMVVQRAKRGERVARSVVLKAAEALGVGIANVFNILNPEIIVIGGGVSRAGSLLVTPAVKHARRLVYPRFRKLLTVKRARLGDDAGLLGAAYVAFNLR